MDKNQLYYGDNLEVLRKKVADSSVDLCYIDPPFNSKRNYFQIYNNIGKEDLAQAAAFTDTWEWGDEADKGYEFITNIENLQAGTFTEQTVELIRGLRKVLGTGALLAYLVHMTLRIREIHRVLKPTGSFYLHCDPTASHYLKLVLDSIFVTSGGTFVNEIVWSYKSGGASKEHFSRKHDVILFYAKSVKSKTFNLLKEKSYNRGLKPYRFKGVQEFKDEIGWYTMVNMVDVWRINMIGRTSQERLGYPTQKPEELLERIISASSNKGDVVLDAYCGCGTTVAVADRLERRWIGIDITYQSISLILKRLQDSFPDRWKNIEDDIYLDGVPKDIEGATALAHRKDDRTRKEFEKWAILRYTNNQARINEKKGADGGVDGMAYFVIDADNNGKVILQAKSGGVQRKDIAALNSDRQREDAELAVLITLQEPTKPMLTEANGIGIYKHPHFDLESRRIQVVTIEEILEGKRLALPSLRQDMTKSAQATPTIEDELPFEF
ncbi:DNA methyltransferase [Mycobacteroides abscessus]|uniref:DNA methyltransferase n=1 Tax=Mycobacteroides abscessus TaxID=36809 RepID=UPI00188EEE1F|nr:DNA methyltransferase [Mycobacteroides abscessus]